MKKIRVGIVGYGNLGKAAEKAVVNDKMFSLVGIFTRRPPSSLISKFNSNIISYKNISDYIGKIDVMMLCGGSSSDLPEQGPSVLQNFNTIDTFDTHAIIERYYRDMDHIAKATNHSAIIACGWDPGIFSLMRLLFESITGKPPYTFWGKGVSQGHSEAVRKIEGVEDAVQYTIPNPLMLSRIANGEKVDFNPEKMHLRQCYVVEKTGADKQMIEDKIKNMPYYFEGYETSVDFVSLEVLDSAYKKKSHAGNVISEDGQMNFMLKLDSNPDFTASVILAYSKVLYRMIAEKKRGAFTVFDIPFKYLNFSGSESDFSKL